MFASFNPHNSPQKKTILSLQCADEEAEAVAGATQDYAGTGQAAGCAWDRGPLPFGGFLGCWGPGGVSSLV